jgi:hypothetical protein
MRDQSISRMSNYCRRQLNYASHVEIYDGNNEIMFYLNNYPLHYVEYIKFRSGNSGFETELCDPETDLIPISKTGKIILINGKTLPQGISNIEIKYFAGYSDDVLIQSELGDYEPDPDIPERSSDMEIPNDLRYVCLIMTAEAFLKSFQEIDHEKGSRFGLSGYSHHLASGTESSTINLSYKPEEYLYLLDKYKSAKIK